MLAEALSAEVLQCPVQISLWWTWVCKCFVVCSTLPLCLTVASMAGLFLGVYSCTGTYIYLRIHCVFNCVQLLQVSPIYFFSVEAFVCPILWSHTSRYKHSLRQHARMAGERNTLCKCCIVSILETRDSHVHEAKFSPLFLKQQEVTKLFVAAQKKTPEGASSALVWSCRSAIGMRYVRDREVTQPSLILLSLPSSKLRSLIVSTHWLRVRGEARLARSSQAELYMYFWGFPSHTNSAVAHLWFHVQYLQ